MRDWAVFLLISAGVLGLGSLFWVIGLALWAFHDWLNEPDHHVEYDGTGE